MMETYRTALKENAAFSEGNGPDIIYRFDCPEYALLREKYPLPAEGGDLEKTMYLLAWVNQHIRHTGGYDNSDKQDALTLLSLAYDTAYGINCLAMSIVLCECLLAVHVRARVVYMMPQSAEDGDNHVVVEVFVPELGKWILLDPTYGSMCLDLRGNFLNLYEIRRRIAADEDYTFSEDLDYNGDRDVDLDDVKTYYAKNLFFFRCKSVQGYGEHREFGNMLEIAPRGFDVHGRMTWNLDYRIETYGGCGLFTAWKKYEERLRNQLIGIERFYGEPV